MTTLLAKANDKSAVNLVDSPIPAELVVEGRPAARIWVAAQSADFKVTQGVWDCSAGKFNWEYAWEEFVMVLEGEVTITCEGGQGVTLRAGDFGHFPLGLKAQWHVPNYVKKTFVIQTPEPLKF